MYFCKNVFDQIDNELFFAYLFIDFPLIKVRRKLYKPNTTAGKGVKWEWLSLITSEWNLYNMDVQNIIEDAWSKVRFESNLI